MSASVVVEASNAAHPAATSTAHSLSEDEIAKLLCLTSVGRRNLPELAKIADQNDDQFFACLDALERSNLLRLLAKLAEHHQIRDVPVE